MFLADIHKYIVGCPSTGCHQAAQPTEHKCVLSQIVSRSFKLNDTQFNSFLLKNSQPVLCGPLQRHIICTCTHTDIHRHTATQTNSRKQQVLPGWQQLAWLLRSSKLKSPSSVSWKQNALQWEIGGWLGPSWADHTMAPGWLLIRNMAEFSVLVR